ncbi:MAG: type II toxin-antitoxin system RelE/ParE family toxin [Chloroflexaceae bacterium]|nr:type II toxin-antitoxin system RelE/ParE family toxin [Chloroflexaceae bacterium]
MSYHVEFAPELYAEVKALPGHIRAQARQQFRSLAKDPRPPASKELRGKPGFYRLWLAGRWRIVYTVDDDTRTVRIIRVRRKEQIDYEGL